MQEFLPSPVGFRFSFPKKPAGGHERGRRDELDPVIVQVVRKDLQEIVHETIREGVNAIRGMRVRQVLIVASFARRRDEATLLRFGALFTVQEASPPESPRLDRSGRAPTNVTSGSVSRFAVVGWHVPEGSAEGRGRSVWATFPPRSTKTQDAPLTPTVTSETDHSDRGRTASTRLLWILRARPMSPT